MPVTVATFGRPEDITPSGFDGKIFRFNVVLIDRADIGTPREPSRTKSVRIKAEVSDSRIETWHLPSGALIKVVFEIVKEHLIAVLSSGTWDGADIVIGVNTDTHKGRCPFDPALIQEPDGAVVEIEIKRPIGFI